MTTQELQHLGKLLTSGEDNAKLAREIMIGQGIWDAQHLYKALATVPRLMPHDLFALKKLVVTNPSESLWAVKQPQNPLKSIIEQWFQEEANHHNPTDPTTPTQTSAGAPSGTC